MYNVYVIDNVISNNYLEITSDGNNLFLLINNIPGLKIYNNHQEVKIDSILNNYVSIQLDEGLNKIEIKYEMPLFYLGIVCSIIGVFLLLIYKFIPVNPIINTISYYVYFALNIGLLFYFYIYSFIKYMI